MVNSKFIALCSRAWALQILAYLGGGGVARISPMAHTLGAGRTATSASIQHLIALGYVKRSEGHGHPLRPEYTLTPEGQAVAAWAQEIDGVLKKDDWALARRAWTLPVLRLAEPSCRFGEFREQLSPITDRALSQTLKVLCTNSWMSREVHGEALPPRVIYTPSGLGKNLTPYLEDSFLLSA